jgi:hypothetical protein
VVTGGSAPAEVARALLAALAGCRVDDVVALTDPAVVAMPVTRPGLAAYQGHAGMAELVHDLHAIWGKFKLVIEDADGGAVAEAAGGRLRVMLRLQVVECERGPGTWPVVLTEFTVRNGLVLCIDSRYEGDESS